MIPVIKEKNILTTPTFQKRSYNFRGFIRDFAIAFRNLPKFMKAMRVKRISPKFSEHVMLAITAVNECRYCSWAHTRMALEMGCTSDEIKDILEFSEYGNCNEEELVALTFAQHYAETNRNPNREILKNFIRYYGKEKANDILNFIHTMTVANLIGNTVDAFESRMKGIPPENGGFFFEFLIYLLGLPVIKSMQKSMRKSANKTIAKK